jgi:hypothetical protein
MHRQGQTWPGSVRQGRSKTGESPGGFASRNLLGGAANAARRASAGRRGDALRGRWTSGPECSMKADSNGTAMRAGS